MTTELERTQPPTPATQAADARLITRGADLVYLAEASYLGMFRLAALLTIVGSCLSICFAGVSKHGVTVLIIVFAAAGIGAGCLAYSRSKECYVWLRHDALRQISPLLLAVTAVLLTGPASPAWWLALPILWVIATVSSARVALVAAWITGCAYLAGTTLANQPLIQDGNAGIPAGAVALAANTFVCRLIAELLARFILRLHELESAAEPLPPRFVPNLAAGEPDAPPSATSRPIAARCSRLSSRELEVALLLRDGLTHAEIAAALGITTRQVERHLKNARERARAATVGQLMAMLVQGKLAPMSDDIVKDPSRSGR